jgi:choline monooxygenase
MTTEISQPRSGSGQGRPPARGTAAGTYDPQQYPVAPSTLPAASYRDAEMYEREVDQVLLRSWLVACPSDRLKEPRDFFVWSQLGQSVMIVRTDDGRLVAWHNVCQHRGSVIVSEESGRCSLGAFKCPWHGFAYDLEGRVVHTPFKEAFAPAQLEGLRTPTVRVEEWSGFLWICLDDNAPSLRESLGDFAPQVEWYGFDGWDPDYSGTWEIDANWKVALDAFNETWHVPFTHRNTVRGGLMWRDATIEIHRPHSLISIPLRRYPGPHAPHLDRRDVTLCHFFTFPNTIFNCFPTLAQCFSAWPTGPRSTTLTAWSMSPPRPADVDEAQWRRRADRNWENFCEVVEEDRTVLAAAGRVHGSKGYRRNIFNAAEGRLTAFHREIAERVGEPA